MKKGIFYSFITYGTIFIYALFLVSCSSLKYKKNDIILGPDVVIEKIKKTSEIKKRWLIAGNYYKSLNKFNYPVIKNNCIYLFYWDEIGTAPVYFVSEVNNWNPEQSVLKRIAGTPLLYLKLPLDYNSSFKYLFSLKTKLFLDPKNSDTSSRSFGQPISVFDPIRKKYPAWMWKDRNNVGGSVYFSRLLVKGKAALTLMHYSHARSDCNRVVFVVGDFKRSDKNLLKNIISNLYKKFGFPPVHLVLVGFEGNYNNLKALKLLSTPISTQLCVGKTNNHKIIYKYLIASKKVAFNFLKLSLREKVDFKKVMLFDIKLPINQGRFRYNLRRVAKKWFHPSFVFSSQEKGDDISFIIKKMRSKAVKVDVDSYPEVDDRFSQLSLFRAQLERLFLSLDK